MINNYLSKEKGNIIKGYSKKDSYINQSSTMFISANYDLLPEEYDVFSEIDQSLFNRNDTEQYRLISSCLTYMRAVLLDLNHSKGVVCVLPKLSMIQDDAGTITFNWAYSTFRATLSFDNQNGNYDAYCNIVFKSDEDSMSTNIRKLDLNTYKRSIEEILQLIVNNS